MPLNHLRRGSGEPLLLLHSLGGTLSQWNPVLDLLAVERELIAVDMPGFGGSPSLPAGTDPTPANLAAAVLALVESLEPGARPGVAGISLGSWVAIECVRQGGASSAVALCPAGFWPEPLPPRRNTAYRTVRALRPLLPLLVRSEGLRRRALATNVHRPERMAPEEALELLRGYGGAEGYADANHQMRVRTVGDLAALPVPLTIAWGEFDRLIRNEPFPDGVLAPGVRQLVLRGCGHIPTWDDPGQVARVILEGTAAGA